EKQAKYRISEYLDKYSRKYWLQHYSKARLFPIKYVEKQLITPWTADTNFKPRQFKNIVMFQENLHPLLNNSANPDKNIDQPHKILTTIYNNCPDLIIHIPNILLVCDLTICNISSLESSALLKKQQYTLDETKKLNKHIPWNEEIAHSNKPNFCNT
uniref:Uncharacterized protein n=1 Tax=Strongyloides stercoralis TaxID=6248 RepID=A0AAF5DJZ8_STRER